jgi:hypothetical protein
MALNRTRAAATADTRIESEQPAVAPTWLGPGQVVFGLVLFTLVAILAAAATVLLIPLRIGTVLIPVSIAFAVGANVVLPLLVRQLVQRSLAAALPVAAWFLTLAVMTVSRPEGDVLIPGGKAYASLTYVFYAVAIAGIAAGVTTVVRSEPRRTTRVVAPMGAPPKTVPTAMPPAKPTAEPPTQPTAKTPTKPTAKTPTKPTAQTPTKPAVARPARRSKRN